MSFSLTNVTIALIVMSVVSIGLIGFMMDYSDYYGVEVPTEYQDSFNVYNDIQAQYAEAEQSVRTGEIDTASGADISVFKNSITSVRLLANVGSFANTALKDLSGIVGVPVYFISAIFTILCVLITASMIAFFTRGSKP